MALAKLGRTREALEAYEEVMRPFGDDMYPDVREQVEKAVRNKGEALDKLGQTKSAMPAKRASPVWWLNRLLRVAPFGRQAARRLSPRVERRTAYSKIRTAVV